MKPSGEAHVLMNKVVTAAQCGQKEEACTLLGRVLARVGVALEADVCQAQDAADKATNEHQDCVTKQYSAELALKKAKQAVLDSKVELKVASKAIGTEARGIAAADKQKRSAASKVQMWDNRKRLVQEVEENAFQPLKEASLDGPAVKKQIKYLRKAGQKIGFDEELMSIAHSALQKELQRRHTFDRFVVQSLDIEFAKRIGVLCSKQEKDEKVFHESSSALEQKKEALNMAKEKQELSALKMAEAKAALDANTQEAAEAKKQLACVDSELKRAMKNLERARTQDSIFRQGPLAAYMKLISEKDEKA